MEKEKLLKQPYKGSKDWYPEDMFLRNYVFDIWIKVAKRYGYEEYDTPLLEDANLYKVKSGEELGSSQLYSFTDKGGREIALRPEMTPSLARIIANKRFELQFPLRWFNIGRFYRYEKPQRGRTREFFQLNLDILGVSNIDAEVEVIQFITDVMDEFKAPKDKYELRINNRKLLEYVLDNIVKLNKDIKPKVYKALDNFTKMDINIFKEYLNEIGLEENQINILLEYINWDIQDLEKIKEDCEGARDILNIFNKLSTLSINTVKYSPYIVRGIAYYTGTVIEMFDIGEAKNPRAMFGGGRYDNLLEIFEQNSIPAFGIGWGDVTTIDFLNSYNLLPSFKTNIEVFIPLIDSSLEEDINFLGKYLRENGINTLIQLEPQKLGNQLKYASKKDIPWVIIFGEEEKEKGLIQLRDMSKRESFLIKKEDIIPKIKI